MRKLVCVAFLVMCSLPSMVQADHCGGRLGRAASGAVRVGGVVLSGAVRVLGVERRQARRAARQSARQYGVCNAGICR